jgi:hypothetical protein
MVSRTAAMLCGIHPMAAALLELLHLVTYLLAKAVCKEVKVMH